MNRQLWLRQALSALYAETPSQKNKEIKIKIKSKISNSESGTPPQSILGHKRSPYGCTSPRFWSTFSRSALSSFRGTASAKWNTCETGSHAPGASFNLSQATSTPIVFTTDRSRGKTAAFHGRRLRSGGAFARTTLATNWSRNAIGSTRTNSQYLRWNSNLFNSQQNQPQDC